MLGWSNLWHAIVAFLAAFGAGAINALAGGGTNLSFPTLLWLGLHPIKANATSAVALWPGSLGGAWGFRQEIKQTRRWWLWMALPSLAGGVLGAFLLVHTPPSFFKSIAPYLVLASTVLVAFEPTISKHLHSGQTQQRSMGWEILAFAVQFIISLYGGYFGAGLGILILTALGLLGIADLRQANGLKNLLSLFIKGVAVGYFIFTKQVVWHAALLMAVGAIIGGYAAATFGHKLSAGAMRWVVVIIGAGIAIAMFIKLAE